MDRMEHGAHGSKEGVSPITLRSRQFTARIHQAADVSGDAAHWDVDHWNVIGMRIISLTGTRTSAAAVSTIVEPPARAAASAWQSASLCAEVARNGFARGQVLLEGPFLDGQPLAMLFSFHAGAGSFAFKIAYDETFAKYAPGVQMTLDF